MTLDAHLIDEDVIALLQTTYPEMKFSLEEIQSNDAIMEQYFTCVNYGGAVIHSPITGEPFFYNEEMDYAGEEEVMRRKPPMMMMMTLTIAAMMVAAMGGETEEADSDLDD